MEDLTLEKIEHDLIEGSLESADIATLRRYLQAAHKISTEINSVPKNQNRVDRILLQLRFLIDLKESSKDQRKNLRWARIGGIAAIAAALFAGIDLYQKNHVSTSDKSQSNIELQQFSMPSQSNVISISTNSAPAVTNQSTSPPSISNPTNRT
jgi:hypothetical protein